MEELRLSSAGLPVLVDEEVQLSLIPKAALSTSGAPGSHLTVELHLTNRRLIAVYPPPMRASLSEGYLGVSPSLTLLQDLRGVCGIYS